MAEHSMPGGSCLQIHMSEFDSGEFEVEDDYICFRCIEADAWKKEKSPIECIIKNYFNECLAAEYKGPDDVIAVFVETESDPPGTQDQKNFSLEKYRTSNPSQWLSVAFSVSVNGKKYHLCCTLEKEITFKPGQCPNAIRGDRSDVIFFTKTFSAGHDAYKFESSLHKDHHLAIKEEGGRWILYLKHSIDEVDETTRFTINPQ